ncbi:MAG: MFS transporter [Candidatus Omnitrophica bacterium]|nr:MFS transporter [Candidatus Omnitrophota bacterium]
MLKFNFSSYPEKVQSSLKASWKEGVFSNMMIIILDYYLVPFGLFLGATTPQIGFLVAIPHLLGSISQLWAVRSIRALGSRRKFLIYGAAAQSLLLVPIASLSLLKIPYRMIVLIALASFFRILGNLISTAWGSLMSDYLPPNKRGNYLGWRSQIVGIAGILAMALAGILLFVLKKLFSSALAFFCLLIFASSCRMISSLLFTRMGEMPEHKTHDSDFTFVMFLRRFKESNFVKFVLFVASITFATQIAAPYFSVHMLKNLKFTYVQYMSLHLTSIIASLIALPLWGKHADHAGNARILKTTSWIIPFVPVLWSLNSCYFYLIFIEALSGFTWAGFNLSATNYVFDAVSPEKRTRCIGYFNLITGVGIFAGASLGGYLAIHLPPFRGYSFYSLFILSGFLRLCAHFFLSGKFKEVRQEITSMSSRDLFFSVIGMRTKIGTNRDLNILPVSEKS